MNLHGEDAAVSFPTAFKHGKGKQQSDIDTGVALIIDSPMHRCKDIGMMSRIMD